MAQEGEAKRGLTAGQVAALLALIVAIAAVYALVVAAVRGRGARGDAGRGAEPAIATGPVVATGPTRAPPLPLAEAEALAREWAAGWQADAQLVGATSGWETGGADGTTRYQTDWTFRYHSAAAGALQVVMVDGQGASAAGQLPARGAPVAVEADWEFVAEDMLLTFLAHGGQGFLRDHPQADVRLQLSGREGGRATWYVSAIDPAAGASLQVKIDALSREVLRD